MPTKEFLDRLKAQLAEADKAVKIAHEEIELAEKAGVDQTETRKELAKAEARLLQMKTAYKV